MIKQKQVVYEGIIGGSVKDCICDMYDDFVDKKLDKAVIQLNGIVVIIQKEEHPTSQRK
jgi:hypothetical protein